MIHQLYQSIIVVNDMEKSLYFYRDLLGFKIQVDQLMEGEEINSIMGRPNTKVRLVLLQVGEQKTGLIGLASFLSPKEDKVEKNRSDLFSHALVFVSDDIEEVYNRLLEAGEKPICEPVSLTNPRGGVVKIFTCLDPNGLLVEFNQFVP
jgi:catechol 2,3-dioxygenase-like lactoylglutathione lyase family enzyme